MIPARSAVPTLLTLAALGLVVGCDGDPPAQDGPETGTPDGGGAAPPPGDAEFTASDGTVIHFRVYGVPDGKTNPAVLLVHMLSRKADDWSVLHEEFHRRGWTGWAMDLPGHGGSVKRGDAEVKWTKFTRDDWGGLAASVREALAHVRERADDAKRPVALVGASIGANYCLHVAADDPDVKGVALLSAGLDYQGVTVAEAADRYKGRPALVACAEGDAEAKACADELGGRLAGPHLRLEVFEGTDLHGTDLFRQDVGLEGLVLSFLDEHLGR